MSVLFFKRFLQRPFQVASIIPSSKALVERVSSKMDFSEPRVIAEYGPGEGVHSREIARRMGPGSTLLLFELDPDLSRDLERQFGFDPRVHVINGDAARLPEELARLGIDECDYIVSGIPFSILDLDEEARAPAEDLRFDQGRRRLHHLPGHERTPPARHSLPARRLRVLPAEYPADVHHGFLED